MDQSTLEAPQGHLGFGDPIPTPPHFPVEWPDPEGPRAFWEQDRMHFPEPATPLMESIFFEHFYSGINAAFEALDAPMRLTIKTFNGYAYNSPRPVTHDPTEMEAQGKRAEDALTAVMPRQISRWEEFLAEVKEHLAAWEEFDLSGASTPSLLAHLDETIVRGNRIWAIHFLVVLPAYQSVSIFDDMYRDLFGNETAFDAFKLLQGFDNKILETDRALWNLSRTALSRPGVRQVIDGTEPGEVVSALERTDDGRAFLHELQEFLAQYGQRGYDLDLSSRSWIEDPTIVVKNIKDYMGQPDRDPDAELASLAAERERLVADVRQRLQNYPQPVVEQFEFLLQAAQAGNPLTEEHSFWLDFRGMYAVRRVLVECGKRLAGEVIDRPEDVFFLTLTEVRAGLAGETSDARNLVRERRERLDHFRLVQAPPILGTMPPGPPPNDPGTRFIMKFWGGPPQPPIDAHTIQGTPGSPGVARGIARIVHSLNEAGNLQSGDVLVCETTAPPWTPLFTSALAVVTDTGGVLSHCAVVAREYGIPAVVGTGMATAMIRDGQLVEVDGNTGVVRILDTQRG